MELNRESGQMPERSRHCKEEQSCMDVCPVTEGNLGKTQPREDSEPGELPVLRDLIIHERWGGEPIPWRRGGFLCVGSLFLCSRAAMPEGVAWDGRAYARSRRK